MHGTDRISTTALESAIPLVDRLGRDRELPSDLRLGEPLMKELDSPEASFFEGGGVPVLLVPAGHTEGKRPPDLNTISHVSVEIVVGVQGTTAPSPGWQPIPEGRLHAKE